MPENRVCSQCSSDMILPRSNISIKATDCGGDTVSQVELQFPGDIIVLLSYDPQKGKLEAAARLLNQSQVSNNAFTVKAKNGSLKIKRGKSKRKDAGGLRYE